MSASRSSYRPSAGLRYPSLIAALAVQGALLLVLALGLAGPILKKHSNEVLTFDVQAAQPPAPAPALPLPTEKIVTPPKVETEIVTPEPIVKPVSQPQQPVAAAPVVAPRTPDPAPAAAAPAAPPAPPAPAGPVSVGNLGAKMISATPPRYPMESRRKREQGVVVLRLVLSEDGRVQSVAVQKSSGFGKLDEAAAEAARRWRWSPTLRDGKAVTVTGTVAVPFSLIG